jgi:glutamyl/glutaminyl-tRNA synthetase
MDIKPEKSELFTIGKRYYSHLENEDEDEEEEILEEVNGVPNDGVEINLMKKKKRKIVETEEQEVVELQMDDDEERAFFSDPANLTKKARERMRKKVG